MSLRFFLYLLKMMGFCFLMACPVLAVFLIFDDPSPLVIFIAIIIGGFAIPYVVGQLSGLRFKRQAQKHKGECTFYTDVDIYSIKARNSFIVSCLSIKQEMRLSTNYDPAKLTYTSIGAVGRFDYKGESLAQKAYPTGRYYFNWGLTDEYHPVKRIELSKDLLKEAKASPFISQFLQGNELVLFTGTKPLSSYEKSAVESSMKNDGMRGQALGMNVVAQSMPVSLLSRKDCEKIHKWLSGKNVKK